jgi:Domain of unknown function (DUF929)
MSRSTAEPTRSARNSTKNSSGKRPPAARSSGSAKAGRQPAGSNRSTNGTPATRRRAGTDRTQARPQGRSSRAGTATAMATNPKATTFRTRHPLVAALVPVALVLAVIVTMIVIKVTGDSSPSAASASHLTAGASAGATSDPVTSPLSTNVLAALSVSPATLEVVGSGGAVLPPSSVGGRGTIQRGSDGKPEITYIGAEYCPYCAAERWALAVALTRFGTISHLSGTHSSGTDVYPNTQTLSFYGSSYSSPYVDFQAVEEATNQQVDGAYQTLQAPTAAESALLSSYDPQGSIPFLDIGNKYVINGASFSPQLLQGLSRSQIAAQLNDPSSPVALAIDGTANYITAAICTVTSDQPSSVCNTPAITTLVKKLGA